MSLIEYIWRSSYQIVGWEKDRNTQDFPTIFGSGFILKYDDNFVFVTADHVIHPEDHEAGERMGDNYTFALVRNKNKELTTMFIPISSFYVEDEYNLEKYIKGEEELGVAVIPYLPDLAISIIQDEKILEKLYTHELQIENEILVKENLQKLYLTLESITKPSCDKHYIVAGVVQNHKNGIRWDRTNSIYDKLTYDSMESGLYKFRYEKIINITEWEGLSGSPFFDDDGGLVGMIIRVVHNDNLLWVLPMCNILESIKRFIQVEKLNISN